MTRKRASLDDEQGEAERREAAEAATRTREGRLRARFDLAKVCIWECDLTRVTAMLHEHADDLDEYPSHDPTSVRKLATELSVLAVNQRTPRAAPCSS